MTKEWDAEEFRAYLKEHHKEYEPVFYSGNIFDNFHGETVWAWKEAELYTNQHPECKTVGTLVEEAGFSDLNKQQMSKASQIYAEESSGTIHGFLAIKSVLIAIGSNMNAKQL